MAVSDQPRLLTTARSYLKTIWDPDLSGLGPKYCWPSRNATINHHRGVWTLRQIRVWKEGKAGGEIRQTRLAWPASSCPLRPDLPPDRVCLHSLWRIPAYTADRSCTRVVLCTCTWPATPVAHSHPQKPNKCTDWLWHNSYSTDRMQIPRRETWHSPPSSGCQHS